MKPVLEAVIDVLHGATYATLATQSTRLLGYPYATVVPSVLDECHRPLLLVSALAEQPATCSPTRAWPGVRSCA